MSHFKNPISVGTYEFFSLFVLFGLKHLQRVWSGWFGSTRTDWTFFKDLTKYR